jgi:hypothetical protein
MCVFLFIACDLFDGGDGGGGSPSQLETPVNLTITNNTLSWDVVSNASSYLVEIDLNGEKSETASSTNSYLLSSLTTAGTYALRVRAIGDGTKFSNSEWSTARNHTVTDSDGDCTDCEELPCTCDTGMPACTACEDEPCTCDEENPVECPDCGEALCNCKNAIDIGRNLLILTRPNQQANASNLSGVAMDEFDEVETRSLADAPRSLEEFKEFTQIILMNVSHTDIVSVPDLEQNLYDFVYEHGGSLLMSGGMNAFQADIKDTLFESMLPVQSIAEPRPVAVLFVLDISNSMTDPRNSIDGRTRLEIAIDGLKDALDTLSDEDYVGLITFGGGAWTEWPIMPAGLKNTPRQRVNPRTEAEEYLNMYEIIDGLEVSRGTWYDAATSQMMREWNIFNAPVIAKHTVFITDGAPTAGQDMFFLDNIQVLRNMGITTSSIAIGLDDDDSHGGSWASRANILTIALYGGGRAHFFEKPSEMLTFPHVLKEEVLVVKSVLVSMDIVHESFRPRILDAQFGSSQGFPEIHGFNVVAARSEEGVTWIMSRGYYDRPDDPIYVVWNFGQGRVGVLMTDLGSGSLSWSRDLFSTESGRSFLQAIIQDLLC